MAKLTLLALLIPSVSFAGISSPTLAMDVGICTAYLDDLGITHTPLIDSSDKLLKVTYDLGYQRGKDEIAFSLVPTAELYTDRKCHRILAKEKEDARINAQK